jgi:hypothetical protein
MKRRVVTKPKHRALVYHRAAVTHFAQLVPVTVAFGLALVTMSLLVALGALALGEALLVVVVPRTARFREAIDEALESTERLAAAEARATVLARMSDLHLRELAEIERLATDVRERWTVEPGSPEAAVERSLALDRLVLAYVRLAVAHRQNVESFGLEGRLALEAHAARLAMLPPASGPRVNEWLARRRDVIARRQAAWSRAFEERDTIAQELATIADVFRWMHELGPDDPARADVDLVLGSCLAAVDQAPQGELDIPIDASVLDRPSGVPALAC